jgi:threonine aldolase
MIIDLRSDTVTQPGPDMRRAMAEAAVGDAVYGEDPTINQLEARVAKLLGKEAALFVATGTMANTLAIRLCSEPGDELVCEASCHPIYYEAGGSGAFSGVLFKPVQGDAGILNPEDVERVLYEPVYYRPNQRAILVENTSNRGGGTVYPLATIHALHGIAKRWNLRMHMDGARLWNAHIASGISLSDYARSFKTVSVCFSKGLGAPVGSALAGTREDIERARHYRHMLGGSWRQAGILAAAVLYALDHNLERLAEDHDHAQILTAGLEEAGYQVLNRVETNMLYVELPDMNANLTRLEQAGVRVSPVRPGVIRCVTHHDVDEDSIQRAIAAFRSIL